MKALQITAPGEALEAATIPEPQPGDGEVAVEIEYAGICRSDVHYRAGTRPVPSLPLVPGHEISGHVIATGEDVGGFSAGDRVAVHYLVSCGVCEGCRRGGEQFCATGAMIGLDRQGGYAERIVVPSGSAVPIPAGVSTEAAAVMMCSTATSLHALRRGRLSRGDRVAVFGAGGLGMSAIQLARALGAGQVYAIDINPAKLAVAGQLGAVPVSADGDAAAALQAASGGVDVALELVGSPQVMAAAVRSLAPRGRAVAVGITGAEFGLDPYRDLVRTEAELAGSSDHLLGEVEEILGMAALGEIDIDGLITNRVPLEAAAVNEAMDRLERFGDDIRTVIEV